MARTVAIDFDGVVHAYSKGWADGSAYDGPVEGSLEAIDELLREGWAVFIHSARPVDQIVDWFAAVWGDKPALFTVRRIPEEMRFWSEKGVLGVTNRKLAAVAYIDDRAIRFVSWDQALKDLDYWSEA